MKNNKFKNIRFSTLSRKIDISEKEEFYNAKFDYFNKLGLCIMIVSSLSSLTYWISDCQLFGHIAWETFISRFSILPVLFACLILMRIKHIKNNYRIRTFLMYVVAHSIMWCTIWSIWYLPDRLHANEGFIIIQIVFIMIGLCVPRGYSIIFHSLVILNIVISNGFNHYENFDLMLSLGIPLLIGSEAVIYYIEEVFADKYISDRQLSFLTYHDQLTNVYNRNKLYDLCIEGTNILNIKENSSVIIIDIDYFKKVNDTYGHDIGDLVLQRLTEIISLHVRQDDIVMRWGGEEFVIIFPETDLESANIVAERIRKAVEECPDKPSFTISIGVASYDGSDYHNCIRHADEALYYAKNHGRNKVHIA